MKPFWAVVLGIFIVGMSPPAASAAVTLGELLAGGSLQSQNLIFDNWRGNVLFLVGSSSQISSGPVDEIFVTLDTSDPLNSRLIFTSDQLSGGPSVFQFNYDVHTSSGAELIHELSPVGIRIAGTDPVTEFASCVR